MDFKIHKPAEVTDENISEIINDIYDSLNRISEYLTKLAKES